MTQKRFKPVISMLLIFMLLLSMTALSGCGTKAADNPAAAQQSATRQYTDDMGRTHTLPVQLKKVFSTSPIGAIMTYTLAPEKIVGWNAELRKEDIKYILPELRKLPNLGGWQSKSTGNIEEILKAKPDVVISMGDNMTETDVSTADKIQGQLGIPVILIKLPLVGMDETYKKMGELLGAQEKAAELAAYYKATMSDIQAKAAGLSDAKKVKVYYAEGADGLTTEPKGSTHIQTLEIVGGVNVAAEIGSAGKAGQTPVSMEQVLKWDPDVILCWSKSSGGAYDTITTDPAWAQLKAVKNKQVYEIPSNPYNWFDRPPSVNRIIGFKWLGNLLYPDVYQYDIAKEVKTFYKTFYQYDLSDEEITKELMVHSLRK